MNHKKSVKYRRFVVSAVVVVLVLFVGSALSLWGSNDTYDEVENNSIRSDGDYNETEELYFQISNEEYSFPASKVFYVVPLQGVSVAFDPEKENGVYAVPDSDITIELVDGDIEAKWGDAVLPGFYEMWSTWAAQNQEFGIVL